MVSWTFRGVDAGLHSTYLYFRRNSGVFIEQTRDLSMRNKCCQSMEQIWDKSMRNYRAANSWSRFGTSPWETRVFMEQIWDYFMPNYPAEES
jgi:hypothetical protein